MSIFNRLFGRGADILYEDDYQLLLLANVNAYLGIALVSPLLDSLTGPFGVSPVQIGLVVSVFSAPTIVLVPLAGVLADRYGRKPILVTGLLLFGVAGTAIAATTSFHAVLALRFVQGIGFSFTIPIIITSIGDMYCGVAETTAQGFRVTVSGVSQSVFPVIAGALVVMNWRYPFLLYAFAIPVAGLVFAWFREPTEDTVTNGGADDELESETTLRDLKQFVLQRRSLFVLLARSLQSAAWFGFLTYNSIVVVQLLDGTPAQAGVLVGIGGIIYAVTASQAGRFTDYFGNQYRPLFGAHVCLTVGLTLISFAPSVLVAAAGTALLGLGVGLTLSLYRSIISTLPPAALRGSYVGVGESLGRVSVTLTPIAMGVVVTVLEPTLGFDLAVRNAILAVAIVAGVLAGVCIFVASVSPDPVLPGIAPNE